MKVPRKVPRIFPLIKNKTNEKRKSLRERLTTLSGFFFALMTTKGLSKLYHHFKISFTIF